MEGGNVGVALSGVALLFLGREPELFEEAQRIGIPAGDIQIGADCMMVELGEEAHEIVDHIAPRRKAAQDRGLFAVEGHHLIGGKAPEIELMRRVGDSDGQVRQVDCTEVAVIHRPEDIAPCCVERADRAVFLCQPAAEGRQRGGRITDRGVVAAIFVVGLPRSDGRVRAIAPGHCRNDPPAFCRVARMAEAIMPARAEAARLALRIMRDHVGHGVDQPFGRRCGGGAHDDLKAGRGQHLHRTVQPRPVELARSRLDPRPYEFTNTHARNANIDHAPRIICPIAFGPLFGIVTDT